MERSETLWHAELGRARLRFLGRSPESEVSAAAAAAGVDLPLASLRQVHSSRVLAAPSAGGLAGAADALVTSRPSLALAIAVADCVPVALAGADSLALAHAGWRGIVAGVVAAAAARMGSPTEELRAWIGPAIGPCCYEVDRDVAEAVAGASGRAAVVAGEGPKPHLDLTGAVEIQLRRIGVERVESLPLCTRCHPRRLWSYRREGPAAGRNFLFGWLEPAADGADSRVGRR